VASASSAELEGFLHDAAALHRFVQSVCEFCEEQERSQTYLPAGRRFFSDVRKLGEQTLAHLQRVVDRARKSQRTKERRQKLVLIKACWREIHRFAKPAADAHTLKIPVPLLDVLEAQVSALRGWPKDGIVILLSPHLNYFQHSHGDLRDLTRRLGEIFREKPVLADFGLIAIPYSQATNVFTNLLIYHEVGHCLFEERSLHGQLDPAVDRALAQALPGFRQHPKAEQAWCHRQLTVWAEEVYCDLFALSLIGPAYSFACMELFSLLGLLEENGCLEFNASHPSEACRFKEHLGLLRRSGWWGLVGRLDTDHVRFLKQLGNMPENRYGFPLVPPLARAFLLVRPSIRALVRRTVRPTLSDPRDFKRHNTRIQELLEYGVVPSSYPKGKRFVLPNATSIINASFCFYLRSLGRLAQRAPQLRFSELSDRARLAGRVEMWTMKALDDWKLLTGYKATAQA